MKEKIINSPIIILQNGLGVEEPFLNQEFNEIYRCVLFATSQLIETDFVQYKPIASSPIGIIKGKIENLNAIVEILTTPRFEFKGEEDIKTIVWEKAIINSAFNSICPLLDIDNGIFYRNKEILALGMKIVRECINVAKIAGIDISEDKIQKQILNISNLSTGQLISTLQDIQNNRKTEIQSLNLEIVRIAKSLNQKVSTTTTELLGKMILFKSELKR